MQPKTGKTSADYSRTYRLKSPAAYLYRIAKYRAKKKNIEFSISIEDVVIPSHCPILGIELTMHADGTAGGKNNSYSLDRIDSSKGYVKGNVQVISYLANSMKRNATQEQLCAFAKWILKSVEHENLSDT